MHLKQSPQCLVTIGESPYVKRKAHHRHYPEVKIKRITEAMKQTLITNLGCQTSLGVDEENVEQLRRNFNIVHLEVSNYKFRQFCHIAGQPKKFKMCSRHQITWQDKQSCLLKRREYYPLQTLSMDMPSHLNQVDLTRCSTVYNLVQSFEQIEFDV